MELISEDSIDLVYTSIFNFLHSLFPSGTPATVKSDDNVFIVQKYNNKLKNDINSGAKISIEQMAAHKLLVTLCDYRVHSSKVISLISEIETIDFTIRSLEDDLNYYQENKKRFSSDSPIHKKNFKSQIAVCMKQRNDCYFLFSKILLSNIFQRFPIECEQYFDTLNIDQVKLFKKEVEIRSDRIKTLISNFENDNDISAEGNLGRRERQLNIIDSVIKSLKYPPTKIPLGGKDKIKNECLNSHPSLFTASGFDHAWKVGLQRKLFRLSDHNKFSSK